MKARHAAQIRAGVLLARQPPMAVAWALTYTRYTGLTFRAYRREDAKRQRQPQAADSGTSATGGSDWRDREEGTQYTPEQLAQKFLDSTWEQQVTLMERAQDNADAAFACHLLNHEGAHIFATQHSCQDRYWEGFEAGKQALADHMQALADQEFGPVPEKVKG